MKIAIVGTGYVGLVTGACFADSGHEVVCIDKDAAKVALLNSGGIPIYEPGLEEIVARNVGDGRLSFTTSLPEGIATARVVFIAVGTPQGDDGSADLSGVWRVVDELAAAMNGPKTVVIKSTVPVGTNAEAARRFAAKCRHEVDVASNPEFLKEGAAIEDCLRPDRVVAGVRRDEVADTLRKLYATFLRTEKPFLVMSPESAELTKYTANAMLATKISFVNEMANLCERVGADFDDVRRGIGHDKRIGFEFMHPGPGFGGSCFVGEETVFVADDTGAIRAETLASVYAKAARRALVPAGAGEEALAVVPPPDDAPRVLAFDLDRGEATLSPVRVLTRRPYSGTMIRIRTRMGRETRVTADHPVIIWEDGRPVVRAAAEVREGDELALAGTLPDAGPVETLDLLSLLDGTALERDVFAAPDDDSFTRLYPGYRHLLDGVLRHPEEVRRHNRMRLALYRRLHARGVLDVPPSALSLYTAKGAGARIRAHIPVDAAFVRLCGYYLAEGFIARDTGRAGKIRERVGFCFHVDEKEYIADVQSTLARLGLKFREKADGKAHTTYTSSRVFAWLLRDVLGCGSRSEDKALPAFAFRLNDGLKRELVRGAFSGDGSVTELQGGRNLMFEYGTVSGRLADGLALLLQTLGIVCADARRMMTKSTMPARILRVAGHAQLSALSDAFGGKHRERIRRLLDGYDRIIRPSGYRAEGATFRVKVASVEQGQGELPVYSLETDAHTVTVGGGLVLHNCFPKDIKALAYIASAADLPSRMMEAVGTINDAQKRILGEKINAHFGGDLSGKTVAVWGLAFKPRTDDIREAPALTLIDTLLAGGAKVRVHDPAAMDNVRAIYGEKLVYCDRPYGTLEGADALAVVTEWQQFRSPDLEVMRRLMASPAVFDGRNIFDPKSMAAAGFIYHSIGRQPVRP